MSENEEVKFENYKQRQNYYKEKYKNRGSIFFAQNVDATIYTEDGRMGKIRQKKGRTYRKPKEVEQVHLKKDMN